VGWRILQAVCPKKTEYLGLVGRSRDLPDAYWLLASSWAFKHGSPNCTVALFVLNVYTDRQLRIQHLPQRKHASRSYKNLDWPPKGAVCWPFTIYRPSCPWQLITGSLLPRVKKEHTVLVRYIPTVPHNLETGYHVFPETSATVLGSKEQY